MRRTPVVVGLDLSLTGTGIAVGHAGETPRVATVGTKGAASAPLRDRVERLRRIDAGIRGYLEEWLWAGQLPVPALIVVEGPTYGTGTGHQHDRSGLWWLVVDRFHHRYDVAEVAPTSRAKYAAGRGNASKDEVLAAVVRRYPAVPVGNNNEADATVLHAMGSRHLGHPIDNPPATHLKAMDAVHWPNTERSAP